MSAIDAVTYGAQAVLFGVAIYVAAHTVTRPTRNNLHILAFFALLAVAIAYVWVYNLLEFVSGPIADTISPLLIITLPYVLLRLADKFSSVPRTRMRVAEIGLIVSYLLIAIPGPGTGNPLILLFFVSYFALVCAYCAYRFYAGSVYANGITRKRLRALTGASAILGISLFTVAITSVLSGALEVIVNLIREGMIAGAGLLFLIGFAPPRLVRQAWQEPELRQFMSDTLRLPRWSSMEGLLRHIEAASAHTVGAPNAAIGLWNPETELLEFQHNTFRPGETIGGRAFQEQRPILSLDPIGDDPESREVYESGEVFAVMAAPITTDDERLGVIALYSPNPPIFADDDLLLLTLLADQIAILLENRKHLEAQAELAAREEAARLKDEFLSIAAHDLKTPLTTIIATGQYLERRFNQFSDDSPEVTSIKRLNRESRRLRSLVQGLLDASRIERGQFVTQPEPTDLTALLYDVLDRTGIVQTHTLRTEIEDGLQGNLDSMRIQQVVENLLENARKYSPRGSVIELSARQDGDEIRIAVRDNGIGISPEEQEKVFDRYFRSPESLDGAEPGIGLGLHICREVVQQHGGRIWVESEPGNGSTFHVALHQVRIEPVTYDAANSRS